MWLMTKNSFVSVVQHRERPNDVLVRARKREHLNRLFPKKAKSVLVDDRADYKYRLIVSKKELATTLTDYIMRSLKYDNFKAAQSHDDPEWTNFLHQVWHEGFALQK